MNLMQNNILFNLRAKGSDNVKRSLRSVRNDLDKFSKTQSKILKTSQKFRSAGFSTMPASFASGAALTGIIKSSMDFEKSLVSMSNKWKKFGDAGKKARDKVGGYLNDIAKTSVQTHSSLTAMTEELAGAGLTISESQAALPATQRLATAAGGKLSGANAVRMMTALSKGQGIKVTADNMEELGDKIAYVSTRMLGGIDEISGAEQYFSAMRNFGGIDEGLALYSMYKNLGLSGKRAGRAVRMTASQAGVQKTSAAQELAGVLGTDYESLAAMSPETKGAKMSDMFRQLSRGMQEGNVGKGDALRIMDQLFKKRLAGNISSIAATPEEKKAVGENVGSEARRTKILTDYLDVIEGLGTGKAKGVLKQMESEMEDTSWGKMKIFFSNLQSLAITMGQSGIMEMFDDTITSFTKLTQTLSKASPGLMKFVGKLLIFTTIISPALIGISSLITIVGTLINSLLFLKSAAFASHLAKFKTSLVTTGGAANTAAMALAGVLVALWGVPKVARVSAGVIEKHLIPALEGAGGIFGRFAEDWKKGLKRWKSTPFWEGFMEAMIEGFKSIFSLRSPTERITRTNARMARESISTEGLARVAEQQREYRAKVRKGEAMEGQGPLQNASANLRSRVEQWNEPYGNDSTNKNTNNENPPKSLLEIVIKNQQGEEQGRTEAWVDESMGITPTGY